MIKIYKYFIYIIVSNFLLLHFVTAQDKNPINNKKKKPIKIEESKKNKQ